MFAPHCPSCRRRVLLGTDQIVRLAWADGRRTAILRCFCGTLVDWDQTAPTAAATPSPIESPHPAGGRVRRTSAQLSPSQ